MAVATLGNSSASTTSAVLQSANISQQDFLQILLTQLSYQDPLKPMDNQAFVAQLAQFTTLAQTQQLNGNMSTLLTLQAGTQSVGLLGKTVDFNSSSGTTTGSVTALTFDTNGQPLLTVKTSSGQVLTDVSLADVTAVR